MFRLEHIALETPAAVVETVTPSLTQYHVAAEQQQESAYVDDESDRISLNCEDGSLSSHSPDGNYATDDVANQSRRSSHSVSRSNDKVNVDENVEHMLTESNDQQDEQIHSQSNNSSATILDFSLKLDDTNKNLFNSTNRPRSLNPNGKARSGKRKHQNGNIDGKQSSLNAPTRIFHADAFCSICRKVRNLSVFSFMSTLVLKINKSIIHISIQYFRNSATNIFSKHSELTFSLVVLIRVL